MRYLILVVLFFISGMAWSQEKEIVINLDNIENEAERVEIQRYIGYEDLFYRYTTLPYDVSVNTGGQGRYFDISYVALALFPLALLLVFYKKKKWFYSTLVFWLVYLFLSFGFSYINIDGYGRANFASENWNAACGSSQKTFAQSCLISLYNVADVMTSPIKYAVGQFSGTEDHLTNGILFALLLLNLFLILRAFKTDHRTGFLATVVSVFLFFWVTLSGGIIWYGFILIPILLGVSLKKPLGDHSMSIVRGAAMVGLCAWMISGYAARVSNISPLTAVENLGKEIVNGNNVYFSVGMHSAADSRNQIYNNISTALEKINQDDSYVYQIGTSLAFDIKNSSTRVIGDNILMIYFAHKNVKKYRSKNIVDDMIKYSGFRYLIVDLYTPTLDKTPEKSLQKKFQLFLNELYNSKSAELLATDRVLEVKKGALESYRTNSVFVKGLTKTDQLNVINHGSYAIFELK